jgi:hypothetical protein
VQHERERAQNFVQRTRPGGGIGGGDQRYLSDRTLDNARQTPNLFLVSESIAKQSALRRDRHGTCEAREEEQEEGEGGGQREGE